MEHTDNSLIFHYKIESAQFNQMIIELCFSSQKCDFLVAVNWLDPTQNHQPFNWIKGYWLDLLNQYFAGKDTNFNHPIATSGTKFQQQVWQQIAKIPYGKVMTYGEIAKKINSSPRAVGNACGKNPIPIIIPCHRVTAKNGLGGFSFGDKNSNKFNNLQLKQKLLELENN